MKYDWVFQLNRNITFHNRLTLKLQIIAVKCNWSPSDFETRWN